MCQLQEGAELLGCFLAPLAATQLLCKAPRGLPAQSPSAPRDRQVRMYGVRRARPGRLGEVAEGVCAHAHPQQHGALFEC